MRILGGFWGVSGDLGSLKEDLEATLGGLGGTSGYFGAILGGLGGSWADLGVILGDLGVVLGGYLGVVLGDLGDVLGGVLAGFRENSWGVSGDFGWILEGS